MSARNVTTNSFDKHGWHFVTTKAHIASSSSMEDITIQTGVSTLPEMVYPFNSLTLTHINSNTSIKFEAIPAISRCLFSSMKRVQVAVAHKWGIDAPTQSELQSRQDYDWTYCSDYKGEIISSNPLELSTAQIDMQLLQRPDPILWYDEVVLFEDELHDHGTSVLSVKIRVMPQCFLVLLRHWLRVDGVILRVSDTRVFHRFESNIVSREFRMSETEFNELIKKGSPASSAYYRDANIALPHLHLTMHTLEAVHVDT